MEIKRYKHDAKFSYTLGMALTIELIKCQKDRIQKIYIHPDYVARDNTYNIFNICQEENLPYEINQKVFNRLSTKGNTYVIGVFEKYDAEVEQEKPHIVLVNPSDSGNLGTIIRTGLGFGFKDYVIIRPAVDIYDPKTIRSSMGAIFHVQFSYFDTFEQYLKICPAHKIYSFMLDGTINLKEIKERPDTPFSLVFGNEAAGLSDYFHNYGESIYIAHSNEIDSLNLSVAFGIAANVFSE
ncbi:MAG: TrmH family RNA methyltransferase [Clostridiales bacterium]|nr:TrmH family RNA methyltransferase [Clostridiales bacterium]